MKMKIWKCSVCGFKHKNPDVVIDHLMKEHNYPEEDAVLCTHQITTISTPKDLDEKYICHACGTIKTLGEIYEDIERGGQGYCMCEFSTKDPETGEVWYPRILNEFVPLTKLDELILAGPVKVDKLDVCKRHKEHWWLRKPMEEIYIGRKVEVDVIDHSIKLYHEDELGHSELDTVLSFNELDILTRIVGKYRKKGRCKK